MIFFRFREKISQNKSRKIKLQYWLFFGIVAIFIGVYSVLFPNIFNREPLYVEAASTVISCATSPTITLGVDFNTGDALTLNGGGTCTLTLAKADTAISLSSLYITGNTYLKHAYTALMYDDYNQIKLNITGDLTIDSGSRIDVTGLGYLGARQLGNSSDQGRTNGNTTTGGSDQYNGGSHGGRGGRGASYLGYGLAESYDSIINPVLPGGGGGAYSYYGGSGGGVVVITAGSATINGSILANGNNTTYYYSGAGAGGTINLNISGTISGNGTITANGGNATSYAYTGGGGGRISLTYGTNSFSGTISAYGGDGSGTTAGYDGSAGTVYKKAVASTYGDLYVDNSTRAYAYHGTEVHSDNDDTFAAIYLQNLARLFIGSDATNFGFSTLKIDTGTVFESDIAMSGLSLSTSSLYLNGGQAKFDNTLTLNNFDTTEGTITGTLNTVSATMYITSGAATVGNGLTWLIGENNVFKSSGVNLDSLTIKSGGVVSTPGVGTSFFSSLKLNLAGSLDVQTGGNLSLSGKGYLGALQSFYFYNSGLLSTEANSYSYGFTNGNVQGSGEYSGGSHGGRGGTDGYTFTVANSYDSIINPVLPGGGGGGYSYSSKGGNGGGVAVITAGSATINGNIKADGNNTSSNYSGAGAGGSINLNISGTISGSGTITANGGDVASNAFTGGGGGRITLTYGTNSFAGTISAYGGNGVGAPSGYDGAAGTVYKKAVASTYGDLYIDNGNHLSAYYNTGLLTTIPTADQLSAGGGYAFNSITVSGYGVLNVPAALDSVADDTNGELLSCTNCTVDDDNLANGEIVYDDELISDGATHDYTCAEYKPLPSTPTVLYVNDTDAAAGLSNPTNLTTLTPVFTYNCNTPNGSDCTKYEIQVDNDSNFSSTLWDTGSEGTSLTVADGAQSANITYAGSALAYNTTYYWRVKIWNASGESAWSSSTNTFYAPRFLELYNFNYGGAVQVGQEVDIAWGSLGGPAGETVKIEYATDGATWHTVVASTASASSTLAKTYAWTIPNDPSATVKIKITSNSDASLSATSENNFTIQAIEATGIKSGRTFDNSIFYNYSSNITFSSGNTESTNTGGGRLILSKKKGITITNNTAGELTNFQTAITVTYDADMQADFDDIRFAASDGTTLLDYWLESKTDSTSAVFWVEVPTIPAASAATIYMLYGSADASTASNGFNTFLLFDDFETGAVSSTYWTLSGSVSPYWTVDTANSPYQGTYSGINANISDNQSVTMYKTITVPATALLEFYWKVSSEGNWDWLFYCSNNSSCAKSVADGYISGSTSWAAQSKTLSSGLNFVSFGYSKDGSGSTGTDTGYLDVVKVRQTATSDPTVSFGSEENNVIEGAVETVYFVAGESYNSVNSFSATTAGTGVVHFQISGDNGATWKYCVGDTLTVADDTYAKTNTAAQITDACLSGLSAGTFNVRAFLYMDIGQTATLSDVSYVLSDVIINSAPTASNLSPVQTSANIVTVTTTIADTNLNTTSAILEYSLDNSTWASSTLANVTVSEGAVTTSTGNIAGIDTNIDGSVDLTIGWNVLADIPNTEPTTVYFRIIPNDGTTNGSTANSIVFSVDTKAPTAPGNIIVSAVTTSTVNFTFPTTTSTDNNFLDYRIYYSTTTPVTVADSVFTSSTDSNLGNSNFNGQTTSAALTGLEDNTLYYFTLFAFDSFGHSVSSAETSTTTILNNTTPTLASLSLINLQDGTGHIKIMVTADDGEDNNIKIKTEYKLGSCDEYSGTANAALVNSVSSTYYNGDIVLNNAEANGWRISTIKTSSGANEVWYYWDSATDLPAGSNSYCLFLTPNDGTVDGTRISATVTVDNTDPSAPGNLSVNTTSTNSVTFNFGSPSVEDNFKEYKIHYRLGSSGAIISDSAITSSTDANLGSVSYNGAGTTVLSGLSVSTQYVANIWAYDNYGNYTPAASEISWYTLASKPNAPTVSVVSASSLHLTVDPNSNPANVTYTICKTADGSTCDVGSSYVQADGSLGASAVWQSYASWGGAGGIDIIGLSENAGFRFLAQARNGDNVVTALSDASLSTYTYSGAMSALAAADNTNTTTIRMDLTFTTTTQSGLKITRDTGCDGTYETTVYDNALTLPNSPTTLSSFSAGTCYQFKAYSYNIIGVLNTTDFITSNQITTPPGQVLGLTTSDVTDEQIDWVWTATAGATGYNLYLYNSAAELTEIVAVGINSYSQTGLTRNSTYTAEVRAQNNNGIGVSSGQSSAVTDATVPTGLAVSSRTTDSIIWIWDADTVAENETQFLASDEVQTSGWITANTWTRNALSANSISTGKVKARNSLAVETNNSATVSSYSAQNVPTGLTFSSLATDGMTVAASGDFPNNGVGSAALYFADGVGGSSGAVVAGTSWVSSGLTPNTRYTYTVYAANSNGINTATVSDSKYTLANTPGKITATAASASSFSLALSANNNPAATNFLIYCTTTGQFVDTTNKTLTGDNADFDTLANWGAGVAVTGLTPNTAYQFQAIAKNGDNILTASSTQSDVLYTLASLPASVTVSPQSPTSIKVSWAANSNPNGTQYWVEDVNSALTNSSWITDTSYTFAGLTPGAEYAFQVKARNADTTETAFVISAATAADPSTPGAITVTRGSTATSLDLVLNANGNSTSVTYARIFSTTTGQYVDTAAKTLTGDSADFVTFNNWGDIITVTGLTPNTAYQFDVVAKNTVEVLSSTSTDSTAIYTRAAVPASVTAVGGSNAATVTWQANGNPSGTEYYVQETTGNVLNSGWTTSDSYTFSNLEAGTQYSFKVKAKNADGVVTDYSSTVSVSTASAGGAAVVAAPPVAPVVNVPSAILADNIVNYDQPFTENTATLVTTDSVSLVGNNSIAQVLANSLGDNPSPEKISQQVQLQLAAQNIQTITTPVAIVQMPSFSGVAFDVGGESHSVACTNVSLADNTAMLVVRSTPQKVSVRVGEEKAVDINADGYPDLYMKLKFIDPKTKKAQIVLIDANDFAFVINSNLAYTSSTLVNLYIKEIPNVVQIAVSEDPSFKGTSFQPYIKYLKFNLSAKEGLKTVYLRLRTAQGAILDIKDSITYTKNIEAYQKLESSLQKTTNVTANETILNKIFKTTLRAGSRGEEVEYLQSFLRDLGHFKYPKITGFFGRFTWEALLNFQKSNKLKTTGVLDKSTIDLANKMLQDSSTAQFADKAAVKTTTKPTTQAVVAKKYIFIHDLCSGNVSQEVRELQKVLQKLGYLKHVPTARYATETRAAVKKFQIDHDITPVNGCVGPKTREALNKL